MKELTVNGKPIVYDYDPVQDMLYILFDSSPGTTFYEDVDTMPGVMLRYSAHNEQVVGITAHHVTRRLETLTDASLQKLVGDLVQQLQPSEL